MCDVWFSNRSFKRIDQISFSNRFVYKQSVHILSCRINTKSTLSYLLSTIAKNISNWAYLSYRFVSIPLVCISVRLNKKLRLFLDLLFIVLLTSSVWIVSEIKKFIENGFIIKSPSKKSIKSSKYDFDVWNKSQNKEKYTFRRISWAI